MTIDLDGLARGVIATKTAGEPIVANLRAMDDRLTEAFELLGPHAYREVGRAERTLVPAATLAKVDGILAEAMDLQVAARTGFDDAFGQGTWMSSFLQQDEAFTREARRILADPRLGPESADTARSLLGSNSYLYGEAVDGLRMGRVETLANPQMHEFVKVLDDAALERANSWRDIFERAPAAG